MNAFLTKDHHNKQRLYALRGYMQKADRLDYYQPKPKRAVNPLWRAIRCAFGFHDWSYSEGEPWDEQDRFCRNCKRAEVVRNA